MMQEAAGLVTLHHGDALDGKAAIRRQLAACRGDAGDGPPTWEEWAR
jgi:hypothetical protein